MSNPKSCANSSDDVVMNIVVVVVGRRELQLRTTEE
jgi:hypothetical protein